MIYLEAEYNELIYRGGPGRKGKNGRMSGKYDVEAKRGGRGKVRRQRQREQAEARRGGRGKERRQRQGEGTVPLVRSCCSFHTIRLARTSQPSRLPCTVAYWTTVFTPNNTKHIVSNGASHVNQHVSANIDVAFTTQLLLLLVLLML